MWNWNNWISQLPDDSARQAALRLKVGLEGALSLASYASVTQELNEVFRREGLVRAPGVGVWPHALGAGSLFDDREGILVVMRPCSRGYTYRLVRHRGVWVAIDSWDESPDNPPPVLASLTDGWASVEMAEWLAAELLESKSE